MQEKLLMINVLFKELNQIYRNYGAYCDLPEAAVWILYALRDGKKDFTQKQLSELWLFKKQTINSALKVLLKKNFVRLEFFLENKKNKRIILTSDGEAYIKERLDAIIKAEQRALETLDENEFKQLFTTLKKYSSFLDDEIKKLMNANEVKK